MTYTPQVEKAHYEGKAYRSQERWNSYYHQLALVRRTKPERVLEVGLGEGVVAERLRADGILVTTLDIAKDLKPDVFGSVTEIPLTDATYDAVLCAEVLEHIRYADVPQALLELRRVSKKYVIIGLPHPGYVFSLVCKFPLLPRLPFFFQVPFFWKTHVFNGEHYWELGKRGYSVARFIKSANEAGLSLVSLESYEDDPGHRFFLFSRL
jgi:SAM-dependent methyltransferase